ncbi:hypothetical protein F0562_017302 [Nyssa sinensis]|uniref:CCHC-type domain-containing protein n=1 Tax=Nyssa sinensis TaxID=561372 RepID=A0A5J4ZEE3_9ASTE|nr:hypothetical protein F0562_017302 [Nyssa sinensis]
MRKKYEGNARVKRSILQALRKEFETFEMKTSEKVCDYFSRVMSVANKMRVHGECMVDVTIVGKILHSLTDKFNYIVCSIKESKDIYQLSIDELQSLLIVHEQKFHKHDGEEQALKITHEDRSGGRGRGRGSYRGRGRGRGRQTFDKSLVECYNCHKLGHFQYECPSWGKKANFAELDEKEAILLMSNFADKGGKVWQGGGGRNPTPEAPHLVLTTSDIESLRPKSPMKNQQQLQQQQSASISLTTANSTNSRRPSGNSPQNHNAFGLNQEASSSNPSTPAPSASPLEGFKGREGVNMASDDRSKIHFFFFFKTLEKNRRNPAMETKVGAVSPPSYDDFEPLCSWRREDGCDTLILHLPEFKREQLKVYISNHGVLKIKGERAVDRTKWSRFCKKIRISKDYNANEIHANFDDGRLYIVIPKKITSVTNQDQPTSVKQSEENQKPKLESNQAQVIEKSSSDRSGSVISKSEMEFSATRLRCGKEAMNVAVVVVVAVLVAVVAYTTYRYRFSHDGINLSYPFD